MKNKKPPDEGIRTGSLLRGTVANYIRLIGDADRKARIMIVVNSILLTISLSLFTSTLKHIPNIWISAILLIAANLLSLFFVVVSVKPELHSRQDKESENNILHYNKCSEYSLRDYSIELMKVMEDNDKKREAVIKDLYFYGNLLTRKYKLIKIAYRIFFWGILSSVVSYVIILLLIN
jgi:hypothetical protein